MKKGPKRLLILTAFGGLLIAGLLCYRYYWLARPLGKGPAGPVVSRDPFLQTWTERDVLLLAVGDSITAGYGTTPGRGYVDRLIENPEDDPSEMQGINLRAVLPNLRRENMAVSCSTSFAHLDMLQEELAVQDPAVLGLVVMTTGGNDLIHWYGQKPPKEGAMYGATIEESTPWIDNFEKRLSRMLDLLDERFPGGCLVFLADIYDPTDGVGDAQNAGLPKWPDGLAIHTAYNEVIRRAAGSRDRVYLVPLHRVFLGHGVHCRQSWRACYRPEDPTYWYYDNLEDPNDRGYDAIRRVFLNEIAAVAEAFRRPTLPEKQPEPSHSR